MKHKNICLRCGEEYPDGVVHEHKANDLTPEMFKKWLQKRHLAGCAHCQKKGEAVLIDTNLVAWSLFKEFYEAKDWAKKRKI